ncbi:MAG TPA: DoxX family protein [Terriglobia bacterium]|nr:DoxX family protein [Terriglobia bacterium]
MTKGRILQISRILLRIALSAAFLSAIADRFGVYGRPGAPGVSWGDWLHFLRFVAYLNWFVPKALIPTLGIVETIIEFALAVALLVGFYQRIVAWASAGLLFLFALTMSIALGIKAPLSYGVFTAFAATLLLGAIANLDPA